jgi:hypothetical protein
MTASIHSFEQARAQLGQVRAMIAEAQLYGPRVHRRAAAVTPGEQPGEWRNNPGPMGLPRDCPVQPLGISGQRLWFLDGIGQVIAIDPPYGKGHTLGLFGGELRYLEFHWPRWGKEKSINGFANDELAADLIKACTVRGPWDAFSRLRGRGCWTDAAGGLVVHTGTAIYSGGRPMPPGEIEGHVYPTRGEIPGPYRLRETSLPFEPGPLVMAQLRTWNWGRADVDPHLLLGWIGAAFLGAALPWRPMVFLTGGKGTGKSTLQALVKGILGDWLIDTADTTAAGIYQRVGLDSIPIAVDELESDVDDKRAVAVLKLARLASSGAAMLRGGSDHNGTEFAARSAFLFSSINAPPMKPAELSRMALLNLDKLKPGQQEPMQDARVWGLVGQCILHRLVKEWPRFHATYEAFAGELQAAGMESRGQKQFGTLLACADLILHEGWDEERLGHAVEGDIVRWRDLLKPAHMLEFENATDNWLGCLQRLLSVRVEAWRNGVRTTVGQVLEEYYGGDSGDMDLTEANRLLGQAGLRIVFRPGRNGGRAVRWLVVPNSSPLVRELFRDSIWAGADSAGVWSGALRQGPPALWIPRQERVNGVQMRSTLLSLDGLYGPGGVMADVAGEEQGEGEG